VEQERLIQRHDNLMNVNNLTIVGLQPYTDYHVDVSTVRKRDDKRPARDSVRVMTSEHSEWANTVRLIRLTVPSSPIPYYIRATDPILRQSCVIAWRPPTHPNGLIERYELEVVGRVRHTHANGASLTSMHRPTSSSPECTNLTNVKPDRLNDCEFDGMPTCVVQVKSV
jgi:hypothetical protein